MKSKESKGNKRRSNFLQVAPANYLIVCEGKQTEPNYFNGLKQEINKKYGNKVEVLIPNIDVKGTGMNTTSLVKYTQRIINYSHKIYGQVWVVFDKDDYNDEQFDVSKDDVLQELSAEFKKNGLGEYSKNNADIFNKVTNEGKLNIAIKNCESMEALNKEGQASQRNPMTKVYKIVDGLKEYLE